MRRQSLFSASVAPVTTTQSMLATNSRQATTPAPQHDGFHEPSTVEAKVVLLGAAGVGKSSLLKRFLDPDCSLTNVTSTIGASFSTKTIYDHNTHTTLRLQIWDTAGQERFKAMSRMYYRNAHAAILCYDVTNQKSWEEMKEWLEEMRTNCEFSFTDRGSGSGIIVHLVGTKVDLVSNEPHKREVGFEQSIAYFAEQVAGLNFEASDTTPMTVKPGNLTSAVVIHEPSSKRSSGFWTQDLGWDSCHEVSALDNDGIEEVFRVISKKLIDQKVKRDAFEAGQNSDVGDYFSGARSAGAVNGSFRLGHGRRKSWLGLPGVTAGLGIDIDGQEFTNDPVQARQKGRCC